MTDGDIYEAYVRTYGKVRSGHTLGEMDFGTATDFWRRFEEQGQIAVSLAAEDAASKSPMQSKAALIERVKRLVSGGG